MRIGLIGFAASALMPTALAAQTTDAGRLLIQLVDTVATTNKQQNLSGSLAPSSPTKRVRSLRLTGPIPETRHRRYQVGHDCVASESRASERRLLELR